MQSQATLFRPKGLRLQPTFCPSPPWIAPPCPSLSRTVIKPQPQMRLVMLITSNHGETISPPTLDTIA